VTKISELGTTQAATSNRRTLRFLQEPHGVTTQTTPFFIVTAVKTSNLTHSVVLRSVLQLVVTAYVLPISLIPSTLMMKAMHSSETSVLTRATRLHIPEDGILHNHSREILKSYIALTGWAL
jgi:hypothetical protein